MNDNLNERAARAMGVDLSAVCPCSDTTDEDGLYWKCVDCGKTGNWGEEYEHTTQPKHFTTDRNAAHLLLEEVRQRGLEREFVKNIIGFVECPEPTSYKYEIWFATAPLEILVQASVEVLEAK